jgi:small subunit ribosomal protein S11
MATVKNTTKKRKELKKVDKGQVHIHSSFNNTIITVTDMNGNTISQCSAGALNFRGSRKSTPFAAQQACEKAVRDAMEHGLRSAEVYVKGPGQGRESAVRVLGVCGVEVTLIQDVSPIAHNGCRPPKRRRV